MYNNIVSGAYDVVFLTPETLFDRSGSPKHFQCLSQKGMIGMVAVDEAHLVHTWKNFRYVHYNVRCHLYRHSFEYLLILKDNFHKMFAMSFFYRDPFKYIPTLKDHFHSIPLMALTATATPEVKEKIVEMLRNPICHYFG